MASSFDSPLLPALLVLAAAGAQANEPCTQGLVLSSTGGVEADLRTGKAIMQNVSISQCDVSIVARRAEASGGLDTKNSRWVFIGDVRITSPQSGRMQSDQADVEFRNDRILRATIKGAPAQFEQQQQGSTEVARGRAGTIVYEVEAGTVRFANDAWLSNGQNEISGPVLVYDIRREKVLASTKPGGDQRVQITIVPKAAEPQPAEPEAPAADSAPKAPPNDPGPTAR